MRLLEFGCTRHIRKSEGPSLLIWATAAILLTVSAMELGRLSVGNIVRDLLAAK